MYGFNFKPSCQFLFTVDIEKNDYSIRYTPSLSGDIFHFKSVYGKWIQWQ